MSQIAGAVEPASAAAFARDGYLLLPAAESRRGALDRELLPGFDGVPKDLPLSRRAPACFVAEGWNA